MAPSLLERSWMPRQPIAMSNALDGCQTSETPNPLTHMARLESLRPRPADRQLPNKA